MPSIANVASDVVASVQQALTLDFRLEIGGLGARVVHKTVEDGNVNVHTNRAVPARDVVVANGRLPDHAESLHRRPPEIMLGAAEFLSGLHVKLESLDFGALLKGLLN